MDAFSLGQYLRDTRETQGITLENAVSDLRIRQPILEAFEAGEFDATGNLSDIQTRGMLRNYARFLSLDEDHVLRLYDEASNRDGRRGLWRRRNQDPARASSSAQPMQEIAIEQRRAGCRTRIWRSCGLLLLSLIALGVIGFVALNLIDLDDMPQSEAPAATPVDTLTPTRPATTKAPATGSPTPSDRARYSGEGILVSVRVTQRAWMRIISDGVEAFAGIAPPDTLLEYDARSEILLTASNAMALDIHWNGQPQLMIGGRGQRVDIRFTRDDVSVSLGQGAAPTLPRPTNRATEIAAMTLAALTPSATPGPSATPSRDAASDGPLPTFTPAPTLTPSLTTTITMTPTATAILPPRVTQAGLIPAKVGA